MSDFYVGNRATSFSEFPEYKEYTRVSLYYDSETLKATVGNDTGREMVLVSPFLPTNTSDCETLAQNILNKLSGFNYQPFKATGAELDPSADLGDTLTVGGIESFIGQLDTTFNQAFISDINTPSGDDIEHEYPYVSQEQRQIERTIATTRSLITKTAEEIRLEVSNELNGLSSSIDVKLGSITSTVQGLDGRVTTVEQTATGLTSSVQGLNGQISTLKQTDSSLQSQITGVSGSISTLDQKIDSISLSVSNGTNSSTISLTVDGVKVSSKTIQFTGDIVFASNLTDGKTNISGDNIMTGKISAEYLKLGGTMDVYASLDDEYSAGSLGYVTGRISSNRYTGIGMVATEDTAVLGSAQDDVLILSVNDTGIFSGNNIDLHASSKVRIDSDYLVPLADENTYCGSYSYWWSDGYFKSLHVNGSAITASDRRLKENIDYDISKWLKMFDLLKPCSYKFIEGKRIHVGMIAQEVIEAGEAAGLDMEHLTAVCLDKEGQTYGLRYEEFVPILIAKVQQLEKRLEALSV